MNINANIALFGDSIGKGVVHKKHEFLVTPNNAVKQFEEKYGVKVDNRSRFGQTIVKAVKRKVFTDFVEKMDASVRHVAVIELGGNDCDFFWENVAKKPDGEHDAITPLKEFVEYYEKAITYLIKNKVTVVCCNLTPIDSERYFNNVIGKFCDKNKVLDYFKGDFNVIFRNHEAYSKAITDICGNYLIPVLDIRTPFLNVGDFTTLLCEDGIHPNEAGQQVLFDTVEKFIAGYLA